MDWYCLISIEWFSSVLQLLGTPTDSDLSFTRNEDARRYIRQLPRHTRQNLAKVFPHVNPLAIDLIDKMLTINPSKRITGNNLFEFEVVWFHIFPGEGLKCDHILYMTVEEALEHPYLAKLHDTADEPVCLEPFSFDLEHQMLTEEQMKDMIYREALELNPTHI